MILHLLFDDKFSDSAYESFVGRENDSDFIWVTQSDSSTYFKSANKIKKCNLNTEEGKLYLLAEVQKINAVLFHGLFFPWCEWLLKNMPDNVKVAWSCWGGEIYGRPELLETYLTPLTKIIFKLHNFFKNNNINNNYFVPKELFKRIDYCLTSMEEEYMYVKGFLKTDFKYLFYTYYPIENILGDLKIERARGRNIFIGNSATIENNHFDLLWQLKKVGIQDRNIYAPLSYGSAWERNACVKMGNLLFGSQFRSMLDFIPRQEYNSQMLDCSVMIQPHRREQAHGNIVTGLWLGMRVYLSEKGLEYPFFKRIGCIVFSVETDLKKNNPDCFELLSDDDVHTNRNALRKIYSQDTLSKAIKNIVDALR